MTLFTLFVSNGAWGALTELTINYVYHDKVVWESGKAIDLVHKHGTREVITFLDNRVTLE